MQAGQLIVFTGPSGVGKGTLLRALCQRHPELCVSISATTRSPRPGEMDGTHYYFVDRPKFDRMVADGELLEWAEFAGNCYGTPRAAVERQVSQGQFVILEIELQGARQVRQNCPEARTIFILPPSFDELERRLRDRASDSEEAISRRLNIAKAEIAAAREFDIQIVNDDFETALAQLERAVFSTADGNGSFDSPLETLRER
ncbi:MAG TPA: guanylate kinase [Oscillatoriales cyanobacterium M59_W2019_021]|nr:MAG: guanylate kinase [Cyanobacteria bacterium J055]HIK33938.1 guanylate kinase [Oscillatoriales cyanobacterium M4454_W2019_049]HIK51645.1 guanylate kinase [Oscillatoriales cyanobacterium M59_W2019_021]